MSDKIQTIDVYIDQYDQEKQAILRQARDLVHKLAPNVEERMSWGMPTFYLKGNLVHFAIQKQHLGFYPGVSGVEYFKTLSQDYKTSKGSIQFPFSKAVPFDLIEKVIIKRVAENLKEND